MAAPVPTPNVLAVVGETDWWSTQHRYIDLTYDSRLRVCAAPLADASNWRSIYSGRGRTLRAGDVLYFEIETRGGSGHHLLGVSENRSVTTTWMANTASQAAACWINGGNIYRSGAIVQSGLATTWASGNRVGVKVTGTATGASVQFYNMSAPYGAAVALTASTLYIGWSTALNSNSAVLHVDSPDLLYLPAGAQPWGAAARVADLGGYSPDAASIEAGGTNIAIDVFKRTAADISGAHFTGHIARMDRSRNSATGLVYFEALVEVAGTGAAMPLVGMVLPTVSLNTQYTGAVAGSIGYYGGNGGEVYNNGLVSGSHGGYGSVAGDRVGVLWNPATGRVWFVRNGVVTAGDPEAGTGAALSSISGDWRPALTPYGAHARLRFCTHAREQLYRPSYAEAWDGADILPEQHYVDRLESSIRYKRSIAFLPMGRTRSGAPISSIDIKNNDGAYDYLPAVNLRDQAVAIYTIRSGRPTSVARLRCESVRGESGATVRVLLRDRTSQLDRRAESMALLIGKTWVTPAEVDATTNTGNRIVGHSPWTEFKVLDGGLQVSTWNRIPGAVPGFRRSVGEASKHTAYEAHHFRQTTQTALANANFASWSGGLPTSWTVTKTNAGDTFVQHASGARGATSVGNTIDVKQSVGTLDSFTYFARVTVANWVKGALEVSLWATLGGVYQKVASHAVGVLGNGSYWVPLFRPVGTSVPFDLVIRWQSDSDMVVSGVEHWLATTTSNVSTAVRHVLVDLAGFPESAIQSPNALFGNTESGYFSNERPTLRTVLNEIVDFGNCCYWVDAHDVLQFRDTPPLGLEGGPAIAKVITEGDVDSISEADDLVPALSDRYFWRPNFAPHSRSEIVAGVAADFAADLQAPGREIKYTTFVPDPFYAHAVDAPPARSLVSQAGFNGTFGLQTVGRYQRRRKLYTLTGGPLLADGLDPMDAVNLTHSRFGLAAGRDFYVVEVDQFIGGNESTLVLWG